MALVNDVPYFLRVPSVPCPSVGRPIVAVAASRARRPLVPTMPAETTTPSMTVDAFIAALAAKQPTPGGGAAAAVGAAVGAAAASMAAAYTQRKKDKESGAAAAAEALIATLDTAAVLAAADADAAAYAELQRSWKDAEMSAAEKAAIEATALAVPVALVERCHAYILAVQAFLPSCNPNITSDAKVGIHQLAGAACAAYQTALVNTPAQDVRARLRAMLREIREIEDQLLEEPAPAADASSSGEVVYADEMQKQLTSILHGVLAGAPADPYKEMYKGCFAASLLEGGGEVAASTMTLTPEHEAYIKKFSLQTHIDTCIAKKAKGTGPKGPFKFMMSDASDFFTDLSKKLKAMGGVPADATMTAEELAAKDKADAEARRLKEAAAEAERDRIDAENAKRTAEMEASGKKVSGGLHKFDASEVDINGGDATADDFMDAFGF